MTITGIDAGAGSAPAALAVTVEASSVTLPAADGSSISIVTRAGWGCDETLRFKRNREI